ncbi:TetR/AcrR family transcriptional regulator [Microbacterium oleivorans]|uniref:TetR/AcrR family transcriptional regulator n=1 Tax=Microbacterium oleivorans TaxID=273677 RepID=UPI002116335D|nr:TetR/AcrR family transcriptional regulator [Microbacterium oleivorans]
MHAAFQTFATDGFRNGSLRDIAVRANMSEAGLLHHFPTKADLLIAVLTYRDEEARAAFGFDPETGIQALGEFVALARFNATISGVVELFCVLAAESTSPRHPAHEYFRERYEHVRWMIERALTVMRLRGDLSDDVDVVAAAARAVGLWDGLQIQWLFDRKSVDIAEELHSYFSSLLRDGIELTPPMV